MDEELLKSVALIARLELSEKEAEELKKDFEQILAHFEKINELKEGEEVFYARDVENRQREDEATGCPEAKAIAENFNKKDGKYMAAPKSL